MGLTDAATEFHTKNMIGDSVTLFDHDNAALGVGDDDTAFSASQTELKAEENSTDSERKGMDDDYPKRDPDDDGSDNKVRYRSTFGTSKANFKWEEWGLFNDTSEGGGVMHNREVEFIGEKTNKATWVFEVDITLTT